MSGNTSVEGYPYPLTSDFADVQDAYRLVTAFDTDARMEQTPFRNFLNRPSFIGRQLATQSAFLSGSQSMQMTAVDWDNTGGTTVGASFWTQPLAQAPSWWMFGATLLVSPTGTPVLNDLNMGQITVNTVDQVTGLGSSTSFYQRNDESVTAGEWINFTCMAPMYQGSAVLNLILSGSTTKAIATGSRFWGMYLGPVI